MYLGTINSGIKTNDAYTDGNFSIVAPVWSSLGADSTLSGGVLFLEPYVSYGEGGEVAASLGLGYRHLFGTQSVSALTNHDGHQAGFLEEGVFVGANLFVDMMDTEADNQFWQLGVGLEAGTRYVEIRGNYYIPLSERQLAEERRTRETFRTSQTSSSESGGSQSVAPLGGDPYATGNSIVQDALFTNYSTRITRTTTTTTTVERLFQRFEEGMEGWDAEIAVLVPGIDHYMDVMLIGGYYSFDNQPFGPQEGGTGNVEGWKAGIEVRPVPALILTGTWYEDERLTGGDWTVGVQMQIPFEAGDLGDGKDFWSRIGDSFKPRRRHLIERLAEPVGRQNAAVKIANSVEESQEVVSQKSSTSVKRSTRVVSQGQGHLVLADDIVFVNNGDAVGNGIQAGDTLANGANGTAEHPFDNVTEGAVTAGTFANSSGRTWNVYTQGSTGITYNDVAQAIGSTRFISSFHPIIGTGGKAFGGNTDRPILDGGILASNVPFLQVTGYEVHTGTEVGAINPRNVQEVIINQNVFDTDGADVRIESNNGHVEASVTDNIFNGGLIGMMGQAYGSGTMSLLVSRNEFNTAGGGESRAVWLWTAETATLVGVVTDNRFAGSVDSGVSAESYGDTSNLDVTVADNDFVGTFANGFLARGNDQSTLTATLEGNRLRGTFTSNGMFADQLGSSSVTMDAYNNDLAGSFITAGIRYSGVGGATSFAGGTVQGNRLRGAFAGDGIHVTATAALATPGATNVTIADNAFEGSFINGIAVRRAGNAAMDVDATGNTLSGTFVRYGLDYFITGNAAAGPVQADITDNLLTGAFERGISIENRGAIMNTTVSNNLLIGPSTYVTIGIRIATISNVTPGIQTHVTGFDGNIVSGTSGTGIFIGKTGSTGSSTVNGTLDPAFSNQVSNETGNKLQSTITGLNGTGQFYLNGNLITLPQTVP
jgi:hypothetical protein